MQFIRAVGARRTRAALIVTGVGMPVIVAAAFLGLRTAPAAEAARPSSQAASSATPLATPAPSTIAVATASPSVPGASADPGPATDELLGSDGRFTVLLLGSDYRPAHPGNRTDTIMVVSVDPTTGAVAAASIPRDTANFPLPDGGTYRAKVNGLYQSLIHELGVGPGGIAMKRAVGQAIGVEIDWYAVVGFAGVQRLVDAVGGVDVVLDRAVHDPAYWVTSKQQGVTFPAGLNHLSGARALIFARTRKGDNDFERARRQQLLVAAALEAVRERGLTHLPDLIAAARGLVRTDLPLTSAIRVYRIVAEADVKTASKVVFGPRRWAASLGGTSFALKLDVVRAWTKKWMAPVAAPGPSPSVGPSPSASAVP